MQKIIALGIQITGSDTDVSISSDPIPYPYRITNIAVANTAGAAATQWFLGVAYSEVQTSADWLACDALIDNARSWNGLSRQTGLVLNGAQSNSFPVDFPVWATSSRLCFGLKNSSAINATSATVVFTIERDPEKPAVDAFPGTPPPA